MSTTKRMQHESQKGDTRLGPSQSGYKSAPPHPPTSPPRQPLVPGALNRGPSASPSDAVRMLWTAVRMKGSEWGLYVLNCPKEIEKKRLTFWNLHSTWTRNEKPKVGSNQFAAVASQCHPTEVRTLKTDSPGAPPKVLPATHPV